MIPHPFPRMFRSTKVNIMPSQDSNNAILPQWFRSTWKENHKSTTYNREHRSGRRWSASSVQYRGQAYKPHKQMDSINNKPAPFYKKVSMGEGLTINCAALCLDELLCWNNISIRDNRTEDLRMCGQLFTWPNYCRTIGASVLGHC